MPMMTMATRIMTASSFHPIPAIARPPDAMRKTCLPGIQSGQSIRPSKTDGIWTSSLYLADFLRPGRVERVIDQRLHALNETHRMRQAGVDVKCRLILPV